MKTILKKINYTDNMESLSNEDLNSLLLASDFLKNDNLVAFPTETVYGLGANGLSSEACKKIFTAKGRPSDNPLILHISNLNQLNKVAIDISDKAYKIINAFWPAPLTLIFKKTSAVPEVVSAGLDTVAVRFPSNKIAQVLIENLGVPVAAPSANLSGKPSCTTAEHVIFDLDGKINMIIDGGSCKFGVESTIIDTTVEPPMILRPGFITVEQIEKVVGAIQVDPTLCSNSNLDSTVPKAPGMKYTHYSPKGEVVLFNMVSLKEVSISKINNIISEKKSQGYKVGVLATDEIINEFKCDLRISLGEDIKDFENISSNLFSKLREFDEHNIDVIYSVTFEEKGIGLAIMNRLKKSAGYNIIDV